MNSTPATMEGVLPLFGIVIAAHNAEGTLNRAIDSVLVQSRPDWRLVIVVDSSRDDTFTIARAYADQDERIVVIQREFGSAALARNAALDFLDSVWFCYLDADDEFCSNYLVSMYELIQRSAGFDVYGCNGVAYAPDGARSPVFQIETIHEVTFEEEIRHNTLMGAATLVKLEALRTEGGYHNCYGEDFNLWLRLLASGYRALVTPQELYRYHLSAAQKSKNEGAIVRSAIMSYRFLQSNYQLTAPQTILVNQQIASLKKGLFFIFIEGLLSKIIGVKRSESGIKKLKAFARLSKRLTKGKKT